jgi:hypothetical protein
LQPGRSFEQTESPRGSPQGDSTGSKAGPKLSQNTIHTKGHVTSWSVNCLLVLDQAITSQLYSASARSSPFCGSILADIRDIRLE